MGDVTSGLLLEPIIGWRIWRVDDDGLLRGLLWGSPWAPRERFEARCEDSSFPYWTGLDAPHEPPCAECTCGIYAFKRRPDAERLASEQADGAPLALGRVSLWGRVLETERGYRAGLAYPYDVELLGGPEWLARLVRSRYAVDVSIAPAPRLRSR